MVQTKRVLEIVGSVRVDGEEFPEVLSARQRTNWPSVVQNKQCDMTSTVEDDHSDAICPGTLIAASRDHNCHLSASVGEEDHSGPPMHSGGG